MLRLERTIMVECLENGLNVNVIRVGLTKLVTGWFYVKQTSIAQFDYNLPLLRSYSTPLSQF